MPLSLLLEVPEKDSKETATAKAAVIKKCLLNSQ